MTTVVATVVVMAVVGAVVPAAVVVAVVVATVVVVAIVMVVVAIIVEKKVKVLSHPTMGGVIFRLGSLPAPWKTNNTSEDLRRS